MSRTMENIEDVRVWAAEYSTKQKVEEAARMRMDIRTEKLEIRVTALEKRLIFVSGVAAGVGALFGTFLERVF